MPDVPLFLFAYANDLVDDQRYLRELPEERRRIREALRAATEAKRCDTVVCPNATIDEVLKECQDGQSRITVFHFAGHADGETLLFEGSSDRRRSVEATPLAAFLGSLRGLKLVVLNGCATSDQVNALLAANVPIVIATSTLIRDDVAADFASYLYLALGKGATIRDAYQQATSALRVTYAKGSEDKRGVIRAVLRDVVREPSSLEAEWPWRLYGDDLAGYERLIGVPRSLFYAPVVWATLIAMAFFISLELFYQFYVPPVVLNDALTALQVGILSVGLWPLACIAAVFFERLGIGQVLRWLVRALVRRAAMVVIVFVIILLVMLPVMMSHSLGPFRYRAIVDLRSNGAPENADEPVRGYVIFRYTPDPHDERDFKLCKTVNAFLRTRDATPSYKVATTYWPEKVPMVAGSDSCEEILAGYDIEFAHRIAEALPNEPRWQVFLVGLSVGVPRPIQVSDSIGAAARDANLTRHALYWVWDRVCLDLTTARGSMELRKELNNWQLLMHEGPESWMPHGVADFVHGTLRRFFPGDVHADCE